jgi:hypothetical protein
MKKQKWWLDGETEVVVGWRNRRDSLMKKQVVV